MSKMAEKGFDYMLTGSAIFVMALLTASVTFLWDLSKNIQELNSRVAVVIEQVSGNDKLVNIQLSQHEKRFDKQRQSIDDITDQLRILNTRIAYITRYVNEHELEKGIEK